MLSLYQYRLPLHKPLRSGAGTWTHREGAILHYTDGISDIVTEASPLPGVSKETLPEVILSLRTNLESVHTLLSGAGLTTGSAAKKPEDPATDKSGDNTDNVESGMQKTEAAAVTTLFSSSLDTLNLPPSAAFAVSAAGVALISQRLNRPINELFGCGLTPTIKVNSVIGVTDEKSLPATIDSRYSEGFRTIKLKSSREPGELPRIIAEATERYSDLSFRVDANRSWPTDKATAYLNSFTGLPVEYCEEPCQLHGLDELARIRAKSTIPVALDESITDTTLLGDLLRDESADVCIIKPPLYGNILTLAGTILKNRTQSTDIVFTSSMDSGIARRVTGWLAAMAGSAHLSHGFDTGRFFKEDLCPDPVDNALFHADTANGWSMRLENCNTNSLIFLTSYGS